MKALIYLACFQIHVVRAEETAQCHKIDDASCFYVTEGSSSIKTKWGRLFLGAQTKVVERSNELLLLRSNLGVGELNEAKTLRAPFVEVDLPIGSQVVFERKSRTLRIVNLSHFELEVKPLGAQPMVVLPFSEISVGSVAENGRARVAWPQSLPLREWTNLIYPFLARSHDNKAWTQNLELAFSQWSETTRTLSSVNVEIALDEIDNARQRAAQQRQRAEQLAREHREYRRLLREKVFLGEL